MVPQGAALHARCPRPLHGRESLLRRLAHTLRRRLPGAQRGEGLVVAYLPGLEGRRRRDPFEQLAIERHLLDDFLDAARAREAASVANAFPPVHALGDASAQLGKVGVGRSHLLVQQRR